MTVPIYGSPMIKILIRTTAKLTADVDVWSTMWGYSPHGKCIVLSVPIYYGRDDFHNVNCWLGALG